MGRPGIGKTTLILKIVNQLKDKKLGGFYTEEIRAGGQREGFSIKTLDGQEGILAHKRTVSAEKIGKYGVNLKDLEEIGAKAIEKALTDSDIIIIDEIGKMEMFSRSFKGVVQEALNSPKKVIATVPIHESFFLKKIKSRYDSEIIEITKQNRDSLADEVVEKIK